MATIKFPIFCKASTVSVLEQALTEGILADIDRICWVYIIDDGTLAYVDPNKTIHKIKGNNKVVVKNVNVLPPITEGDSEILYVLDGIVYTFNGTEYKPSFYDVQIQVDALTTQIEGIDNRLEIAEMNIASQQETLANLGVTVSAIQTELADKADKTDTYTKDNIDVLLSTKADSDDVYGRNYLDNALATKADSDVVYNKQEMNTALGLKADKTDTYTKDDIDGMINVETSSGTISMAEYVNQSTTNAIQDSKNYTDQQIQIHFI